MARNQNQTIVQAQPALMSILRPARKRTTRADVTPQKAAPLLQPADQEKALAKATSELQAALAEVAGLEVEAMGMPAAQDAAKSAGKHDDHFRLITRHAQLPAAIDRARARLTRLYSETITVGLPAYEAKHARLTEEMAQIDTQRKELQQQHLVLHEQRKIIASHIGTLERRALTADLMSDGYFADLIRIGGEGRPIIDNMVNSAPATIWHQTPKNDANATHLLHIQVSSLHFTLKTIYGTVILRTSAWYGTLEKAVQDVGRLKEEAKQLHSLLTQPQPVLLSLGGRPFGEEYSEAELARLSLGNTDAPMPDVAKEVERVTSALRRVQADLVRAQITARVNNAGMQQSL